jgi:hypothetical protein
MDLFASDLHNPLFQIHLDSAKLKRHACRRCRSPQSRSNARQQRAHGEGLAT